eukprot:CAMPEP_0170498318 /NCGR_PEP_ID=MMETSP0208-20121228/27449_1 /TAXON_ID=197538 /ORGANISM="Strombidium inclinatum, Strain S3" /LENGTH=83 /DNA_ID=CAMNT_0010775453 /DNA_START=758 /DNA_END=1009 /DNA_ORIENTATION=+
MGVRRSSPSKNSKKEFFPDPFATTRAYSSHSKKRTRDKREAPKPKEPSEIDPEEYLPYRLRRQLQLQRKEYRRGQRDLMILEN